MSARDENRRDYIIACLRESGAMYEDGARAYLAEHDAARRTEERAEILGTDLNPSNLVLDARSYRQLADAITATMADPNRWDGDDDEGTILARYVQWLATERASVRAEVLREAAEVAVRTARNCGDNETGQHAASVAAGIGKELRRMADEAGKDTRTTGESSTEYGVHIPANDTEREPTVLHVTTNRADAEDQLRHHRSIWPGYGQTLVQRTVTTGPWAPAATGGEPRG